MPFNVVLNSSWFMATPQAYPEANSNPPKGITGEEGEGISLHTLSPQMVTTDFINSHGMIWLMFCVMFIHVLYFCHFSL